MKPINQTLSSAWLLACSSPAQHLISPSKVIVAASAVTLGENAAQQGMSKNGTHLTPALKTTEVNKKHTLPDEEAAQVLLQFKELVKLPLEVHDRQIRLLQSRLNQVRQQAKELYLQTLLTLKNCNQKLKCDLENYPANQNESWNDFKRRFNQQLVQIGMSISKLSKQIN